MALALVPALAHAAPAIAPVQDPFDGTQRLGVATRGSDALSLERWEDVAKRLAAMRSPARYVRLGVWNAEAKASARALALTHVVLIKDLDTKRERTRRARYANEDDARVKLDFTGATGAIDAELLRAGADWTRVRSYEDSLDREPPPLLLSEPGETHRRHVVALEDVARELSVRVLARAAVDAQAAALWKHLDGMDAVVAAMTPQDRESFFLGVARLAPREDELPWASLARVALAAWKRACASAPRAGAQLSDMCGWCSAPVPTGELCECVEARASAALIDAVDALCSRAPRAVGVQPAGPLGISAEAGQVPGLLVAHVGAVEHRLDELVRMQRKALADWLASMPAEPVKARPPGMPRCEFFVLFVSDGEFPDVSSAPDDWIVAIRTLLWRPPYTNRELWVDWGRRIQPPFAALVERDPEERRRVRILESVRGSKITPEAVLAYIASARARNERLDDR